VLILYATFDEHSSDDIDQNPIFITIYFAVVEIVPSVLVLLVLRKLPPSRAENGSRPYGNNISPQNTRSTSNATSVDTLVN
jgi:hypothetical protein